MPPPPKNPFFTLSAEERKDIPLPDRFKCRQCDHWKNPISFSNKEIKDYQFKKYNLDSINGVTARLRCRTCAGEQFHELQCEGPCGIWKSLDNFSKAQRTRGSKWCQECIMWKEAAEPGVITTAAPGTDLSPDELNQDSEWREDYYSGSEDAMDSDGEDLNKSYPPGSDVQALSSTGEKNKSTAGTMNTPDPSTVPTQSTLTGAPNFGSAGTRTAARSGYIPPHMRAINSMTTGSGTGSQAASQSLVDIDAKSKSSASNAYEDNQSNSTDSQTGWLILDAKRQIMNSYDSDSVQQQGPSGQPSPQTKPTFPSAPAKQKDRGSWARPVGARTDPPQFPSVGRQRRYQQGYDSDHSQDEM